MLFNSFNFLIVFPFIFALYWVIPGKWIHVRKWWLIVVSYMLYALWGAKYAIVLFFVTLVTFAGGLLLEGQKGNRTKRICPLFVVITLFPLFAFKYLHFLDETLTTIFHTIGINLTLSGLNWAVPIGISFYTFQALGYMLDVYKNRIKAEHCFTDYVLFCSFFPQTVSGPISKASELLPQIKQQHSFNYDRARQGLHLLLWGLFLKVVLADRLGIYVDTVYANYIHYNGITLLTASFFYTFQIYGDFAGYSLMAVGIGKCLGYDLVNNFNRPYLAASITQFWHRWHISLTRWLTLYIYIPLGGSHCSKVRMYWNILVTFLVSGLWHGANWTYVFWGALHGILQIIEKWLGFDPKGRYANSKMLESMKPLRIILTFLIVNISWIFFRSASLDGAFSFISKILMMADGVNQKIEFVPVMFLMGLLLFGRELSEEYFPNRFLVFNNRHLWVRWGAYIFLISLILLYGVLDSTQFIYVSF